MLAQIAWRNVWRNRTRSLVVITAVALGLIAGIFMVSFSWGMTQQRTRDIIETQLSHIQLHNPEYKTDKEIEYFIPEGESKLRELENKPDFKAVSGRILVNGMLSSTKGGFGVQVLGIYPESEAKLTRLQDRIIAGNYFEGTRSKPVIIGEKLAEKLGVIETIEDTEVQKVADQEDEAKVSYNFRKNIVLTFQDQHGNTVSQKFRVNGIYQTLNAQLEETQIFVKAEDLQATIGEPGAIHEIAVLLNDSEQLLSKKEALSNTYPSLEVEDWQDLDPSSKLLDESLTYSLYIYMGIILLALAFGIINTMLMAVLERTRELGMLMSVGMDKVNVFFMIMLETLFLTLVGAPIGLLAGFGLVSLFGKIGIDLSAFSAGMDSMGLASVVYTYMAPETYLTIAIMVFFTAIISAIYPARRALRLKPAEAVRAI